MANPGMEKSDIICHHCEKNITQYYDASYKGLRGKCPDCGVDFPLE